MSILTEIISIFFSDIRTTILSLLIGLIVYKLAKFYVRVSSLPPGPLPLPIAGNILSFRTKNHFDDEIRKVAKSYGPVFTLWMGPQPFVFITDIDLARDAFRKNEFSGRPGSYFADLLSADGRSDIVAADYGHQWEALRRVAHSAIQKYSTTDKLVYLASDCVDDTIKTIIANEGINKPFIPFDYIYHIFLNILATSAFGIRYTIDDTEFKKLKYMMKDFPNEAGAWFLLWNVSPIFRWLDQKMVNKHKKLFYEMLELIEKKYKSHYSEYNEAVLRDFCDALISAKNDALNEGKESAPYLTEKNLVMAVFDMFFAGTDTSQQTFRWIVLFLSYYPEMQRKLREEIESVIGDRIPTHEDRNRCHYVMAFISETLRFRNIVPMGVFHKAVVTSKIGEHTIPEEMGIFAYQGIILRDENNWKNADMFIPDRFLENGEYMTTRPKAFIPFGVGRRVCLGEKLAIADLFLVLVRFLQSTSDYDIVLHSNDGLDPNPNNSDSLNPKDFKICFKPKVK